MATGALARHHGSGTLIACVAPLCDGAADPGAAALVRPSRFSAGRDLIRTRVSRLSRKPLGGDDVERRFHEGAGGGRVVPVAVARNGDHPGRDAIAELDHGDPWIRGI